MFRQHHHSYSQIKKEIEEIEEKMRLIQKDIADHPKVMKQLKLMEKQAIRDENQVNQCLISTQKGYKTLQENVKIITRFKDSFGSISNLGNKDLNQYFKNVSKATNTVLSLYLICFVYDSFHGQNM